MEILFMFILIMLVIEKVKRMYVLIKMLFYEYFKVLIICLKIFVIY